MTPALIILIAWLLFALSHLYMSGSKLRERLSPQVSKNQFTALFALVTIFTMLVLIFAVARFGDQGWAGPSLGQYPLVRTVLGGITLIGVALLVAGLMNYPKSPMAVLATRRRDALLEDNPLKDPTLVEKVSRHPFFTGIAVFMAAHMLLATTLANFVHFAGYVVFALVGIQLQDKKFRKRWQNVYAEFEAQTSSVPFAKMNKADLNAKPREWVVLIIAILIATFLVGAFHQFWTAWNGAGFLLFDLAFGTLGVLAALTAKKAKGVTPKDR